MIMVALIFTLLLTFALSAQSVFAGNRNANGDNGTQGTDILNGLSGCKPPLQSSQKTQYWVYVPSELLDSFGFSAPYFHEWMGGPCCPSNVRSNIGNNYALPNQCCNGPDYLPEFLGGGPTGEQGPGNHCECFEIRGYPYSLLPL